jgi:hypothetical protein
LEWFTCAVGYHMASLWEIHEPSNLRYDTALGFHNGRFWIRSTNRQAGSRLDTNRSTRCLVRYDKDEASDLTPKERQALKTAIEIELRARQAAKLAKQRKSRR